MGKYKDKFIDNGIEDIQTILELNESHLEKMNIPLGHKLKIVKKIRETRKQRKLDYKPEGGNLQDLGPGKNPPRGKIITSKVKADPNKEVEDDNLLNGNFDEDDSAASF